MILAPIRMARALGPTVEGVIFHKCADEAHELEVFGPVVSLISLPLQAGVDFHDQARALSCV